MTNTRRQLGRWWGWLVLTTVALACLVSVRYYAAADLDSSPLLLLFRGAMLSSHFTLLSLLLLLPVLLLLLLLSRPKLVIPVGVLYVALILAALLIDTQVYHLYRFHINAGVMNLLFGGAARETFVFPPDMYLEAALIFLGIVAVVAVCAGLAWRYVRKGPPRRSIRGPAILFVTVATLVFHGVHIWADAVANKSIVRQTEVLPFRYAATAKRMLRRLGFEVRSGSTLVAASHKGSGLAYPLRPLTCEASQSTPNVIFIVVDSWRFDAIGPKITPNLHKFAQRAVRFENHFSGGNATRIGIFSLFYGIPGTYWHRILAERRRPVFIEELLKRDYEIAVLRSAPLYSPEFDRTIFAGLPNLRMRSEGHRPYEWDRSLTNDFRAFLEQRDPERPFFAFLFYDSPHSFDMPPDYPVPFKPNGKRVNYLELHRLKDVRPFYNRYLNSVHYVDSLMGEALELIDSHGLLESSIVLITGDHGQEFNDTKKGYWGHSSNFTRYQTGVPFMLYAPDLEPRVLRHRTSHFDVVPTILQRYFACSSPVEDYSVGRSLFREGGRDVLLMSEYADFAIVQPQLIAVVREHGLDLVDANYSELEGASLAPHVISIALEHKRRFYGIGPLDRE